MSRFTLSDLYGQRGNLTTVIGDLVMRKAELEEKIRRLEKAASSLSPKIDAIEDSHKVIDDLTIDENRWYGTEKSKFDTSHQALKTSTKEFLGKTEDALTQIEEEINRLKEELALVERQLGNLRSSLSSVNSQISARRNSR